MIAAREYRTSDDLAVALCVLWALKLYKAIRREWLGLEEGLRGNAPAGLQALYIVAKIKTLYKGEGQSWRSVIKEIDKIVDEAKNFWYRVAASDEPLGGAVGAMCLAHVSYWAWTRAQEMNRKGVAQRLAVQSYQASDAAIRFLTPGTLMWAFAVNHSAYIRIRAVIDKDKTQELLRQLRDLNEEHDHYRFFDTRAWAFTELVERVISTHGFSRLISEKELAHLRRGACDNIASAERRLDEGRPWFGDIEITRHRDRLEEVEAWARVFFARTGEAEKESEEIGGTETGDVKSLKPSCAGRPGRASPRRGTDGRSSPASVSRSTKA